MSTERHLPPVIEDGFSGIYANRQVTQPVGSVSSAVNFYLNDKIWRPRPGIRQAAFQLPGFVQGCGWFEELDGTRHTFAFSSGNMYLYNWALDSFTTISLSAKGVAMAASLVSWTVSRGRLVVTDGVNKPWMWDPNADTYTVLTEAPVSKYCGLYYDKVFFWGLGGINGNVFEWSNEGNPLLGYAAQNQDWQYAQQDNGPVIGMAFLNESFNVLKEDSVSRVLGAVEDAFRTDAVREGVNPTEGTPAARSPVVSDGDVYWLAKSGPRVALQGIQFEKINVDSSEADTLKDLWSDFSVADISTAVGAYFADLNQILWFIGRNALVYSTTDRAFSKFEFKTAANVRCASRVEDHNGNDLLMMGDNLGYVYIYGEPTALNDAGSAINLELESRNYGRSMGSVQKRINEVLLVLNVLTSEAEFTISPKQDGVVKTNLSRRAGFVLSGRRRYRRGLNTLGFSVGWKFEMEALDQRVEIEQAITYTSAAASPQSRG